MGHNLSLQKLAFSRVLSRDLGLWVCAACYIRGVIENLAAYTIFNCYLFVQRICLPKITSC